MTRERSHARLAFWLIAFVGLAVDQGTKYGVFAWLDRGQHEIHVFGLPHRGWEVVPGLFSLVRQEELNRGALFGLGNHPEFGSKANLAFTVVSALAVCFITAWSFRPSFTRERTLAVALGLILAGAMGNLYDRVVFGGVRDFLWAYHEASGFNYPVFNVADVLLVCGAGLLLLNSFLAKPAAAPTTQPATTTTTA